MRRVVIDRLAVRQGAAAYTISTSMRFYMEAPMAKGDQRSNKMAKKPKKDSSPPKQPGTSDRPTPPVTAVIPRGKPKTK